MSSDMQYFTERQAVEKNVPRILVTGSRDWTDEAAVRAALSQAWNDLGRSRNAVLVQGECHLGGVDKIAADTWGGWGFPVEGHPAERDASGRVLGPERNARMVALGADLCLAFPLPSSRGTRNCMRLAREAGIPVRVIAPRAAQESSPRVDGCPDCGGLHQLFDCRVGAHETRDQ